MIESVKEFPAKAFYTPERPYDPPDAPTYSVEIFGYLMDGSMIVFRETVAWIGIEVRGVKMLPVAEFKKKFEKYELAD